MRDILQRGAVELEIALPSDTLTRFEQYADELMERNGVMNLTAITGHEEIAARHFLDSLVICNHVPLENKRLIDIGTGGGFPGLPLKLATPSLALTLLDSLGKRVQFLTELCGKLGLADVTCVHARAEEWVAEPNVREGFDYATSRAVARLNLLAELCLPYVRVGGAFLAMKAADSDAELEEAQCAITALGGKLAAVHDVIIPETKILRRIVIIRKVAETPAQYPRRFAKIRKQPL